MSIFITSDNPYSFNKSNRRNDPDKWKSGNISIQIETIEDSEVKRKEIGILRGRRPVKFSIDWAADILDSGSYIAGLAALILLIAGLFPQTVTAFTRTTIQLNGKKISIKKSDYRQFLKTTFDYDSAPKKFDLSQALNALKNDPSNLKDITGQEIKVDESLRTKKTEELITHMQNQNFEEIKRVIREGANPNVKVSVNESTRDYSALILKTSLLGLYQKDKPFCSWLKAYGAIDESCEERSYKIDPNHFKDLIEQRQVIDDFVIRTIKNT